MFDTCSSGILLILTWSLRYSLNRRDTKIKGVGVKIRRLDTHCTQSGVEDFMESLSAFLMFLILFFFMFFMFLCFQTDYLPSQSFEWTDKGDEIWWEGLIGPTESKNVFCTIFDARFLMIPVQVFYKDSSLAISVPGKGMLTWYALLITPVNVHSETDIFIHFRWNCYVVD